MNHTLFSIDRKSPESQFPLWNKCGLNDLDMFLSPVKEMVKEVAKTGCGVSCIHYMQSKIAHRNGP